MKDVRDKTFIPVAKISRFACSTSRWSEFGLFSNPRRRTRDLLVFRVVKEQGGPYEFAFPSEQGVDCSIYGRRQEAFTCSREEDKVICCFSRLVEDVKPRPLDPQNIYQQFKIINFRRNGYFATSIAADGFPPYFLGRRNGWWYTNKTPPHFKLDIAQGLNSKLRARLPDFDFPLSRKTSEPFVVGKWYSPFVFVKEGTLRDQMIRSMYYELTLEQRWEQIFTKAVWDEEKVVDGVIWFTSYGLKGERMSVGLRVEIVERMKWEQERGGWIGGEKRRAKINRVEELKEGGEWSKFGLYVLVERFNLKRMDGSLVMFYDFKHVHQMKTKWE
ncbi:hypothetical protein DH2020_049854 [Rehmannia glutinosa]|uniref:Uncharacterized protein n=1 Tax=Rehmannia glutinosa TaxID=99300 RepID=A0ABR0U1K2_REHGL